MIEYSNGSVRYVVTEAAIFCQILSPPIQPSFVVDETLDRPTLYLIGELPDYSTVLNDVRFNDIYIIEMSTAQLYELSKLKRRCTVHVKFVRIVDLDPLFNFLDEMVSGESEVTLDVVLGFAKIGWYKYVTQRKWESPRQFTFRYTAIGQGLLQAYQGASYFDWAHPFQSENVVWYPPGPFGTAFNAKYLGRNKYIYGAVNWITSEDMIKVCSNVVAGNLTMRLSTACYWINPYRPVFFKWRRLLRGNKERKRISDVELHGDAWDHDALLEMRRVCLLHFAASLNRNGYRIPTEIIRKLFTYL